MQNESLTSPKRKRRVLPNPALALRAGTGFLLKLNPLACSQVRIGERRRCPASLLTAAGEGLAFLATHLLIVVTNTLALVRLRLAHAPNLRGKLADLLLVRAADDDRGRIHQFNRDAIRRLHLNRVGIADREDNAFLVHTRLVTDALDLEFSLESLGHAFYHVGEQAAREAMQRAIQTLII